MALTIPYSGKPERPRRLNYPFISGLVDPKTLVYKCERAIYIYFHLYYTHFFEKIY